MEDKFLKTQDDKWIRIKLPSQWSQNSSSSSSQLPSTLAAELGRETNTEDGASSSPHPDMIKMVQRRIDGLKSTYDAKIAELARELRSIPEVDLKELETKMLDKVEAIREEFIPRVEINYENILKLKKHLEENMDKVDRITSVIEIISNHDSYLGAKIEYYYSLFDKETKEERDDT